MTVKEFYEAVGGEYKTALERMMNDDFIKRMLSKFLANNSFQTIKQGYLDNDAKAVFEGAHALKGVSGNLVLTDLFNKTCVVTEAVRDYANITELKIDQEMKAFEDSYLNVKEKIEELIK